MYMVLDIIIIFKFTTNFDKLAILNVLNRDYYIGFSLSPDVSARDSNIRPRACPRSDISRGLILVEG